MTITKLKNDQELKRGTEIQITTISPFGKKITSIEKIVLIDNFDFVLLTNGMSFHSIQISNTKK